MKFNEKWLREWVNPAIGTEEIVSQITMAGLEVDGVEPVAAEFSGVVVGEVLSKEQHPNADKLSVCSVTDGSETFQVVCGASNVREGLKIPFAKIGAVLPGDFKIKKAKLRDVESFGMLCAESELGLAEQSDGLMELAAEAPVGTDIREYLDLNDQTIEVDLTPNRSDCFSIAGLAREVGVLNKAAVTFPSCEAVVPQIDDTFDVVVEDAESCPKYLGRVIKGVNIAAETPLWMKEKLRRCGLRSIDPAVDVTNYVMLELGQPMHAFDLNTLNGKIVVRKAKAEEKLTLLDGQEIAMRDDTLVIADEAQSLAMAGIMGGEQSGVSSETKDLFLECAFFSPIAIVGKARSYGLHTDSSHRFERGVDFDLQNKAMERATALLLEIVGGQPGPVVSCESEANMPKDRQVALREEKVESLLGLKIEPSEIEEILTRLGLSVAERSDTGWTFDVPSHRFDISIEPDLIEEVGRIYGYNNLPKTTSIGGLVLKAEPEAITPADKLKDTLIALGYQEAITYSFVDPELQSQVDPDETAIPLANPISADMSVMRTSLWTGLLKSTSYNQNRQQSRVRLFETGLKFLQRNGEIEQTPVLAGVASGLASAENWCNEKLSIDFFDVKADLESLLAQVGTGFAFEKGEHPALHPGQTAKITKHGKDLGFLGAVHPKLQKSMDLNGPVYLFELCLHEAVKGQVPNFEEISKFPEVRRDLAILVQKGTSFSEIEKVVREQAGEFLVDLVVFDVYQGENLGEDVKSMALGLTWRRVDRTLNDEEINSTFDRIVSALEARFDAKLRS